MKNLNLKKQELVRNNSKSNSFFKSLCNDSPFLVINTPCGVGKYKFNKIGYDNNDKMVLEYRLVQDGKYTDSKNILHNLGKFYYLSATQLLYAFKFYANS
tara:strand:- start:428 stop:727 length:300 start_codon:yes stop_codon:yes gene_type:complete